MTFLDDLFDRLLDAWFGNIAIGAGRSLLRIHLQIVFGVDRKVRKMGQG